MTPDETADLNGSTFFGSGGLIDTALTGTLGVLGSIQNFKLQRNALNNEERALALKEQRLTLESQAAKAPAEIKSVLSLQTALAVGAALLVAGVGIFAFRRATA